MPSPQRAAEIISHINYLTLATVGPGGEPWNAPVFFAFASDFTLYWGSHKDSQHSQNIRATGRAFIVVYDSTVPPGAGEGVYIQATCSELTNLAEITRAHQLLWDRHEVPYWKLDQVHGHTPVRLYKAVPEKVWMNDEGSRDGHYIDTRTEIEL